MPDINAGREALEYRKRYRGVIGVSPKIPIRDTKILSLVYTPGVAKIEIDPKSIAQRTRTLIYEGEPGYHKEEGLIC
jgi:malic enzyme